jgi:hypothetical protein
VTVNGQTTLASGVEQAATTSERARSVAATAELVGQFRH